MKKVFSLLVICLLLTSCGSKNENKNENPTNTSNQEVREDGYYLVKKESDSKSILIANPEIKYNGTLVKDGLNNGALTIEDITDNMSFVTLEDEKSNMYIVDIEDRGEQSFYVMLCDKSNNNNIYIGTDFDQVVDSCK